MSKKELALTQWGFVLWFLDLNVKGVDVLPDFAGMILLACALYGMSKSGKIAVPLIPCMGILGVDFLVHWFVTFELPYEILIVRVIAAYVIFAYLGLVIARCREQNPGPAKGLQICRIAYIALLALDFVSLAMVLVTLMLVEVAAAWIITLALFILLCRVKPAEAKQTAV